MKKTMWMCAVLVSTVAAAVAPKAAIAQESRQDVSLSATYLFAPQVNGNAAQLNTHGYLGALLSYRFMLTPRSALEANYGFTQYRDTLQNSRATYNIHTRQQEFSLGYVYSRTYHNFSPFLEGGVAGVFFSPIKDYETTTLDAARQTSLGGMFGGGVAYELSPSFDLRVQYHGVVVKAPSFKVSNSTSAGSDYNTGRYEVISTPAIGIAYHF